MIHNLQHRNRFTRTDSQQVNSSFFFFSVKILDPNIFLNLICQNLNFHFHICNTRTDSQPGNQNNSPYHKNRETEGRNSYLVLFMVRIERRLTTWKLSIQRI
ncbi:hypothetical protein AAHE18_11G160700 [Arachis hypogaea]